MILWFGEGLPGVSGERLGAEDPRFPYTGGGVEEEREVEVSPGGSSEEQQGPWFPSFCVGLRGWRLRLTSCKSYCNHPCADWFRAPGEK